LTVFENNAKRLIAMAVIAATGLISRLFPLNHLLWDKYLGDAVYAAVFFLLAGLLWPQRSLRFRLSAAGFYVLAVEFFQLTQIPLYLSQSDSGLVRLFTYLILGTHFSWWDILAYLVGLGSIALLDDKCLRI
jgi:hypothetical protein